MERTPKTPASRRSIIRNHSPYCESTGPLVQEGFVAARVRALQGFSNQAQIAHSPLTPCPGLHVYRTRSPPRPSRLLKPVLNSTDMPGTGTIKRFHTEKFLIDHRNASASGRSTRSSDTTPSFHPQEQQSSLGPITPSRLSRGTENPPSNLLMDTVPSPDAQRQQDHITASSTPYGLLSEVNEVDNVPVENPSASETAIMSPRAIQTDFVGPQATWNCLPQISEHYRDYSHGQALKPQRSIADRLSSMVEQGWVGGDTFGKVCNDDEFASHTTESEVHLRDTRLDSRSDSLSETSLLQKVPSYNGSLSVSTAERRSESQYSIRQDIAPHVKREPKFSLYRWSQKRRQRQRKRSHAVDITQRSTSDIGVPYQKNEFEVPTGRRRAWTLHHLDRSTSSHSQIQREASPTTRPNDARDLRSSEQGHEPTTLPPSHGDSTSKSGFESTMLRDEQLGQDSTALSKVTSSRRSSSNTRELTRSASRSTSFFKKFPWYKVALVDKQPVVQDLSKGGRDNDRISRSHRATQYNPSSDQIELSRGVSNSHALVGGAGYGPEEDENPLKTKSPPNQGPLGQRVIDSETPSYEVSREPSLVQLMTSPQELNEAQVLDQIRRGPERPQDTRASGSKITEEWLFENPRQVVKGVVGHAQSPTRAGPSNTQPSVPSQSGSMDASFESPTSGDVLQSLHPPQWPKTKEHSRWQSSTSSYADSTKPKADDRPEQGSSGSGTARPEQEFAPSPDPSHHLRSKVVNWSPEHLRTRTGSSPASEHKSDHHRPMRREVKGRAKGIKKVQVTVTFDGAEELVVEATLKKKDREERWRTMA